MDESRARELQFLATMAKMMPRAEREWVREFYYRVIFKDLDELFAALVEAEDEFESHSVMAQFLARYEDWSWRAKSAVGYGPLDDDWFIEPPNEPEPYIIYPN